MTTIQQAKLIVMIITLIQSIVTGVIVYYAANDPSPENLALMAGFIYQITSMLDEIKQAQ